MDNKNTVIPIVLKLLKGGNSSYSLWFGYGFSVLRKGSCAGNLDHSAVALKW